MLLRRAAVPALSLVGAVMVFPTGASAVGLTAAPKCVKPGAVTTVTRFRTESVRAQADGRLGWGRDATIRLVG